MAHKGGLISFHFFNWLFSQSFVSLSNPDTSDLFIISLGSQKSAIFNFLILSFKDFIYLLLERRSGREKERERNINM